MIHMPTIEVWAFLFVICKYRIGLRQLVAHSESLFYITIIYGFDDCFMVVSLIQITLSLIMDCASFIKMKSFIYIQVLTQRISQ